MPRPRLLGACSFGVSMRTRLSTAFALLALFDLATAVAAGNPTRGAQVFRQCAACHSIQPGEHLTGPSLSNILNRPAASVPDFHRYSDALKQAQIRWDATTLDRWLANPTKLVPATSMTFAGLADPKQRQDLIAYLEAVSAGKPPQARQEGNRGMQRQKPDLKAAPPEGQVLALKHCGDSYNVETADGKAQKVWEFNLRFKTDSSKLGPSAGKPVAVGAGMQGDRASIVFAAPIEISTFIKESCPL